MASSLFPLPFDETDVRRLCDAAAFTRADAWQRDGHVQQPVVTVGTLSAEVKGSWQRRDTAQVTAPSGKLASTCTCRQPTLCVHAATVLLHWLRQPAAFAPGSPSTAAEAQAGGLLDPDDDEAEEPEETSPEDDLATLLELFSMADLRAVARRRGVRPTARTKDDLVRQLAKELSTAESVDAALAQLSPGQLQALQIVDLLGSELAGQEAVAGAYGALGDTAEAVPMSALLDLALVGVVEYSSQAAEAYAVPAAVAQRLGPFAAPAAPRAGAPSRAGAPPDAGLDLLQALLVLAHEAQCRVIPPRPGKPRPATGPRADIDPRVAPSFWSILAPSGSVRPAGSPYRQARLTPIPPMLGQEERERLAGLIGRSPDFVTFALHVAFTLEIIDTTDRLTVQPTLLQTLCDLPPAIRRQMYQATLAAPQYLGELRQLFYADGPLELHCYLGYFGQTSPLLNQAAHLRNLLVRTVTKLPPNIWYDYAQFRDRLRRWAPFQSLPLSFAQLGAAGRPLWWIADHAQPEQPLDLEPLDGWQQLYGRFVDAVFAGVLTWIGLIDVDAGPAGLRAFRVRPEEGAANAEAARLLPAADMTVEVPAGPADPGVYAILARAGDLVQASPQGLRYRLTPQRIRGLFDTGVDGPTLLQLLEQWSDRPLPAAMRAAIDRWWTGYGRVRLYDDLTLIELADDYLLPELLRTTSLAKNAIHTFSPRLIAVEPQAVEGLIAELTRAGHPPSVAEGR